MNILDISRLAPLFPSEAAFDGFTDGLREGMANGCFVSIGTEIIGRFDPAPLTLHTLYDLLESYDYTNPGGEGQPEMYVTICLIAAKLGFEGMMLKAAYDAHYFTTDDASRPPKPSRPAE